MSTTGELCMKHHIRLPRCLVCGTRVAVTKLQGVPVCMPCHIAAYKLAQEKCEDFKATEHIKKEQA